MAEKKLVGNISHFFQKISVAVVDLEDTLKVGDKILIERPSSSFEQVVESMEIEHEQVQKAGKGQSIGLKVAESVREGAKVYKIME
jgi:translation elongation factor EF-1alpha